MDDQARIEQSIAALEAQRAVLGDPVVDLAISALRQQLADLEVQAEEQRKLVTVMFAELPGLATLSEQVDAEELSDILNAIWRHLDRVALEHGGWIDKHTSGGVMALWGVEHAREDDPQRAIHAALAMQANLASDVAGSAAVGAAHLKLHIGINTGPVVLGKVSTTHEYTAMGDTVNVAHRLLQLASPGSILISLDTYRHVRGVFDVSEQEPVRVKGKRDPVQTYLVLRAKPRSFRKDTRNIEGIETRMVARDKELAQLQQLYRSVQQDAKRQMVTVVGDVGVGKSRLLNEFDIWTEVQPEWFYYFKGRANQETQRLPFGLLRDVFATRFQLQDSDTLPVVQRKILGGIGEVFGNVEAAQMRADVIGQLLGYDFSSSPYLKSILNDADQLRDRAISYLDEYFRLLSNLSPILVLLEDIHWADDSSLDVLQHWAAALAERPLALVCTARPALFERRPDWRKSAAGHRMIELASLDRQQSQDLVGEILQKVEHTPDTLMEMVVENAEGNPFYLEELIKMLIEDGVIITGADRWRIEISRLGSVRVPPTLTGILQARLDGLSAQERSILNRAAVIGRVFWDESVSYLGQAEAAHDRGHERSLFDGLCRREMIFKQEVSLFAGTCEYVFKHMLLRDTVYENVLKRDRRTFHARAAEWLIAHSGERAAEGPAGALAGLIAEHLERADQDFRAAAYLNLAAENALRLSAFHESLGFSERALALLPVGHVDRVSLCVRAGDALRGLSRYMPALRYLEEGLALARQFEDVANCVNALIGLGWIARNQGRYEQASHWLNESLALARQANQAGWIARSQNSLGWVDIKLGDYLRARSRLVESEVLFREMQGWTGLADALLGLGIVARAVGEYEHADVYHTECLTLYRKIGNRSGMGNAFTGLGETARLQGNYATARSYYKAALELDREVGDLLGVAIDLGNLGHASAALDDPENALRYYREGLQVVTPIGATPFVLDILAGLAVTLGRSGQLKPALEIASVVQAHPALMQETRPILEKVLEILRARLGERDLQTGLAEGARRSVQELSAALLSSPAEGDAQDEHDG
jgi:class 3 adenylate cyclase/tetratricopeptide (TPR) repeat protein